MRSSWGEALGHAQLWNVSVDCANFQWRLRCHPVRGEEPTWPRRWEVNPTLNLARGGLSPGTQREMRRVLPGRGQRLNWRGGGETAAAGKPQLRGSAHLSLLPGPKWTGSLTCRGAPALTAPRWGANLPHPRRVGLWACESHLSPRARPDPFLPGFPQSRGRPRRPAASLPGWSAQPAPSRRQYKVPRTPRSREPGARKPRPRRPRPTPPHLLRPRSLLPAATGSHEPRGGFESGGGSGLCSRPGYRDPAGVSGKSLERPLGSRTRGWDSLGPDFLPQENRPRGLGHPRPGRTPSSATCG